MIGGPFFASAQDFCRAITGVGLRTQGRCGPEQSRPVDKNKKKIGLASKNSVISLITLLYSGKIQHPAEHVPNVYVRITMHRSIPKSLLNNEKCGLAQILRGRSRARRASSPKRKRLADHCTIAQRLLGQGAVGVKHKKHRLLQIGPRLFKRFTPGNSQTKAM